MIVRDKLAKVRAAKPKGRKPVQAGNAAAAASVRRKWKLEDAVRDVNARTMALADIVEDIPGVAEHVERKTLREAYAPLWAKDPAATISFLHSLASGLFGMKTADAIVKIASGADSPLDVEADLQKATVGQLLRLVMPSLYSARPRDDGDVDEAEAEALHKRLWDAADYFAGWNVADISPFVISNGMFNYIWDTKMKSDAKLKGCTFKSQQWPAPWNVDDFLFSGLTRATVGDWDDPCPVGLKELEAILDHVGDDFGTRQWVLELGAFNRAKMSPVRFESATTTMEIGGGHG